MKQKKKPLLLMTIVATLVVLLLAANMTQYLREPNKIKEQKAANQETIDKWRERPPSEARRDDAQISDMMQMSSTMRMSGPNAPLGEVPAKPTIELPRLQEYNSHYRVDYPTAHWYKPNSKQFETSEERAGLNQGSEK